MLFLSWSGEWWEWCGVGVLLAVTSSLSEVPHQLISSVTGLQVTGTASHTETLRASVSLSEREGIHCVQARDKYLPILSSWAFNCQMEDIGVGIICFAFLNENFFNFFPLHLSPSSWKELFVQNVDQRRIEGEDDVRLVCELKQPNWTVELRHLGPSNNANSSSFYKSDHEKVYSLISLSTFARWTAIFIVVWY